MLSTLKRNEIEAHCIHFIETGASILREIPDLLVRHYKVSRLSSLSRQDWVIFHLYNITTYIVEYGNEVWEGNKNQGAALESVVVCGAKRILG